MYHPLFSESRGKKRANSSLLLGINHALPFFPDNLKISYDITPAHTGRFDSKFSHIFKTNTKIGLLY